MAWFKEVLRSRQFLAGITPHRFQHISLPSRRSFSITPARHGLDDDLFNYTSGRWIFNDAIRHAERKRFFNVDGLRILAAESVKRSPSDIVDLTKIEDGWSNRSFLITMNNGFRMVASIPYLSMEAKYLNISSEVATMKYLEDEGIPVPHVYGYSATADNPAETEYIFTSFAHGTKLSDIWLDMGEDEVIKITDDIVRLESKIMCMTFPVGGSLYFTDDLKQAGVPDVPVTPDKFSIGPDLSTTLWFGRRSQLSVDRGPYRNSEHALVAAAHKELVFLKKFGQPLLPFKRERREVYEWRLQSHLEHTEHLHRFLRIAPSLVPHNAKLNDFCIRHPDIHPSNIYVDSDLNITNVTDWGRTLILPLFLQAAVPNALKNYGDPVSDSLATPLFSADNEEDWARADYNYENLWEIYRRRLVHYQYIRSTKEHNQLHYAALLEDPVSLLSWRMYTHASQPWDGDSLYLKLALIEAAKQWNTVLAGCGECPISFEPEDILKAEDLNDKQKESEHALQICERVIGCNRDGWDPNEQYEKSKEIAKAIKKGLKKNGSESEEVQILIDHHWPFDDMVVKEYM